MAGRRRARPTLTPAPIPFCEIRLPMATAPDTELALNDQQKRGRVHLFCPDFRARERRGASLSAVASGRSADSTPLLSPARRGQPQRRGSASRMALAPTLALKFWNSLSVGARRYRTRAGFFFLAIFAAPATAGRRGDSAAAGGAAELPGRIDRPPARPRPKHCHLIVSDLCGLLARAREAIEGNRAPPQTDPPNFVLCFGRCGWRRPLPRAAPSTGSSPLPPRSNNRMEATRPAPRARGNSAQPRCWATRSSSSRRKGAGRRAGMVFSSRPPSGLLFTRHWPTGRAARHGGATPE